MYNAPVLRDMWRRNAPTNGAWVAGRTPVVGASKIQRGGYGDNGKTDGAL